MKRILTLVLVFLMLNCPVLAEVPKVNSILCGTVLSITQSPVVYLSREIDETPVEAIAKLSNDEVMAKINYYHVVIDLESINGEKVKDTDYALIKSHMYTIKSDPLTGERSLNIPFTVGESYAMLAATHEYPELPIVFATIEPLSGENVWWHIANFDQNLCVLYLPERLSDRLLPIEEFSSVPVEWQNYLE